MRKKGIARKTKHSSTDMSDFEALFSSKAKSCHLNRTMEIHDACDCSAMPKHKNDSFELALSLKAVPGEPETSLCKLSYLCGEWNTPHG
jgi:hypothetical protein